MGALLIRLLKELYKWVLFIPFFVLATLLTSIAVIILSLTALRPLIYHVCSAWSRIVTWVAFVRVKLKKRGDFDPTRSYIVIADHLSYFDIPVMFGWAGINMKFVMKQELKRIPIFGQGVTAMGNVFVDRSDRQRAIDSLNSSTQKLKSGESVIIYPEGTRSRSGSVGPFRKGAFRLALNTGMPLLPISVAGTDRVQPPDSFQLHPGKVGLMIHEPVEVEGLSQADLPKLVEDCRERVINGKEELEEELGLKG